MMGTAAWRKHRRNVRSISKLIGEVNNFFNSSLYFRLLAFIPCAFVASALHHIDRKSRMNNWSCPLHPECLWYISIHPRMRHKPYLNKRAPKLKNDVILAFSCGERQGKRRSSLGNSLKKVNILLFDLRTIRALLRQSETNFARGCNNPTNLWFRCCYSCCCSSSDTIVTTYFSNFSNLYSYEQVPLLDCWTFLI